MLSSHMPGFFRNRARRSPVQAHDGGRARGFLAPRADHDLERGDRPDRRGDGARVLRRRRDEGFTARPAGACPRPPARHRDRPRRRRGDRRPPRGRRIRPQPRRGRFERQQPRRLRGATPDRAQGARGRGARRRRAHRRKVSAESDLELVRGLVGSALASLETSRGRIDDLNIYPVPDGDTGTNLTLTVRAVADAVDSAEPGDRSALAHAVARAALMGARGNSGVILSQIVRGVADVLAQSTNGIGPALTAQALRGASDAAYRAVRRPVEGTMLSVIRELAEEAERHEADPEPLGELLVELVRHGEEAVARTPEQLEVLREAGVVDAGGAGLVELLRGLAGAVTGETLPAAPAAEAPTGIEAVHLEPSRYRYCTVFVVEGEALDRDGIEAQLERLGDSLVVVGDETALKVHVHTDDPGSALSLGTAAGTIEGVEIANMHEQQEQRERRLSLVPSTHAK